MILMVAPGIAAPDASVTERSEEHTSELQSHLNLVCRLLLEKKKKIQTHKLHSHSLWRVQQIQTSLPIPTLVPKELAVARHQYQQDSRHAECTAVRYARHKRA